MDSLRQKIRKKVGNVQSTWFLLLTSGKVWLRLLRRESRIGRMPESTETYSL